MKLLKVKKPYLIAIISFLAILVISIIMVNFINYSWDGWRQATCVPYDCFSEGVGTGLIRQPQNTWSGFLYILAAFLILAFAYDNKSEEKTLTAPNQITSNIAYTQWFAFTILVTGIGTVFQHAALVFASQTMDTFGMYLLGSFLVFYSLSRLFKINNLPILILSYTVTNIGLYWLLIRLPQFRWQAFASLIILTIVLEFFAKNRLHATRNFKYFLAALSVFALAFFVWFLDYKQIFFTNNSLISGHAFWHLGGSISVILIYLYYCSEKATTQD